MRKIKKTSGRIIFFLLATILPFGANSWAQIKNGGLHMKNSITLKYSLESEKKIEEGYYEQFQKKYTNNIDTISLAKSLKSNIEAERLNAIRILGLIPNNKQIKNIENLLLNDPSFAVRMECAKSLKHIKSVTSLPKLMLALKVDDLQLKLEVALTLAALGEKTECFKALNEIGRKGERNIILDTHQGYLDIATLDAVEKLKKDLFDSNPFVSVDAAIILSELGYWEDAFPVLKSKLSNEDKFIRMAALRGLAYIGDDESIELIRSKLDDTEYLVKERSESIIYSTIKTTAVISYSPDAAANYAENWWNSRNVPMYYDYGDNDCANFVSQCLKAGGINLSAGTNGNGSGVDNWGCMPFCDYLQTNLRNYQNATWSGHLNNGYPSSFTKGDVAIFGSSLNHPTDPWEHATINVVTGTPALNAHSTNQSHKAVSWYYPQSVSSASFRTGDFYHFVTTGSSSPGSFTLTLTPECNGSTSQIKLNWTASNNATSYDVYRNGSLYSPAGVGLTGLQFINSANITVGNSYSYYVKAKNSAGSTNSNTLSGIAPNCSDNFPIITSFSISTGTITLGNNFTLSYSVTDDVGLSRVELWRTTDKNNWGDKSLKTTTLSGQKSYSGSFTDAPPSQGSYWYGLHVVDTKGQAKYEPDPPGPLNGIVSSATLTVTSPNGGEIWQAGTTQSINWTHTGITGTVQIQPYLNGVPQTNITAAAPNTGSYSWSIPSNYPTGTTYKIGISAMSGTVSDFSNNNFIISSSPTPTIALNKSSLSFGNQQVNTTSPSQSYTVSGSNLTTNITINVAGGFQISRDNSSWQTSSITLTPSSGSVPTTSIYVRFVPTSVQSYSTIYIAHSCGAATPQYVELSGNGISATTPTIVLSKTTLSFGNQQVNTISGSQYYTVSGNNLTSNITITTPGGFQMSQDNITWQTTPITLNQTGSAVQNTSIYVRFAATSAMSYSGNINNASSGATTQNVSVSGVGVSPSTSASIKPVPPAEVSPGTEFWVEIKVGDPNAVTNLFGASFILNYNTAYLDYVSSESVSWFGTDLVVLPNNDELAGKTSIGISRKNPASGISGSGVIARIKYLLNASVPNNMVLDFTLTDITAADHNNATIILNPIAASSNVISGISVWSGDTNNDGKVDQADVLPLGIHWNKTGAARQNATTQWASQSCSPWSPLTATYADANGSGKVDQGDVLPIGQNWEKTHTVNKISLPLSEEINQGYIVWLEKESEEAEKNECEVNIKYEQINRLLPALRGLSFIVNYDASIEKIDIERGEYFGKEVIDFANNDESKRELGFGIASVETNSQISNQGIILKLRIKSKEGDGEIKIENIECVDVLGNKVVIGPSNFRVNIMDLKAEEITSDYSLEQNYPNPFNPTTTIEYLLKKDSYIRIGIFNALGQEVMVLREGYINAGRYKVVFDGKDLPSGNYFYKLKTNTDVITRKMTLIK